MLYLYREYGTYVTNLTTDQIMTGKPLVFIAILLITASMAVGQTESGIREVRQDIAGQTSELNHRLDQLAKIVDDVLWQQKTGDIAWMDKLYIYGPPPAKIKNPDAMGARNPVKFWTYAFFPKDLDPGKNTR